MVVREKDVEYMIIPMSSDYILLLTWNILIMSLTILFIVFYIDVQMNNYSFDEQFDHISSRSINSSLRQTRSLINISLE